jgi:hypothetical protein
MVHDVATLICAPASAPALALAAITTPPSGTRVSLPRVPSRTSRTGDHRAAGVPVDAGAPVSAPPVVQEPNSHEAARGSRCLTSSNSSTMRSMYHSLAVWTMAMPATTGHTAKAMRP